MDLYKVFEEESKDGYFTSSRLNTTGYDIWELSKRKLNKDKFRAKISFPVDFDSVNAALDNKAKAYYYIKKGVVGAIYVIKKDQTSVSCNEIYRASDLLPETVEAMDRQIAYLVAKEGLNNNLPAVFEGVELPKLLSKSYFDWSMFLCLGLSIAVCWYICFNNILYAMLALIIGFGCGFRTKYKFDVPASEPTTIES